MTLRDHVHRLADMRRGGMVTRLIQRGACLRQQGHHTIRIHDRAPIDAEDIEDTGFGGGKQLIRIGKSLMSGVERARMFLVSIAPAKDTERLIGGC